MAQSCTLNGPEWIMLCYILDRVDNILLRWTRFFTHSYTLDRGITHSYISKRADNPLTHSGRGG